MKAQVRVMNFIVPSDQQLATVPDASPPNVAGHIPVAEDNNINQMFVEELLKHFGCTCDVVNDGSEALDAPQYQRYDPVLMDCQMPEMDGFTATREIRRRESANGASRRIPIIALTANALKDDRERCLEAGMDDYLCKPLQAAQLRSWVSLVDEPSVARPESSKGVEISVILDPRPSRTQSVPLKLTHYPNCRSCWKSVSACYDRFTVSL